MKLSISQIAWTPAENEAVAAALTEYGVDSFEFVPSLLVPGKPVADLTDEDVRTAGDWWGARRLRPIGAQSLLFNRPELRLFGSDRERNELLDALARVIRIAGILGATPLVFGSPGNRRRDELSTDRALDIASEFFRAAAIMAERHKCVLCIEPNAVDYGCDFINTLDDASVLARRVDHAGFGVNVDAGVMRLSNDSVDTLRKVLPLARHFHISEPFLEPVGKEDEYHGSLARVLRDCRYEGYVSVEMRKVNEDDNLPFIGRAIEFAQRVYLDG